MQSIGDHFQFSPQMIISRYTVCAVGGFCKQIWPAQFSRYNIQADI